jgi:hypothetical protein
MILFFAILAPALFSVLVVYGSVYIGNKALGKNLKVREILLKHGFKIAYILLFLLLLVVIYFSK